MKIRDIILFVFLVGSIISSNLDDEKDFDLVSKDTG